MVRCILITIKITLLAQIWVYGQTCCSGGVPLSANIGLPVSEVNSLQLALNYDVNRLQTLKVGSEKLDDKRRERLTQSVLLELGYTVTKRFSVDLFFSYVRQERNIFTVQGTNSTVTNGIGDAVLLLKYDFTPQNNTTSFLLGIGPKFPLGTTEKVSSQGFALPADLQPGSGSLDLVYWSSFSSSLNFRASMSAFATSTFRSTGVNNDYLGSIEYEFGNEFQLIAGISDRLVVNKSLIDPSLSLRYRKAGRDSNNGVFIEATGGEWVFIMPGIKYYPKPNLFFNMIVELPLYSFVNNTQLTPTSRLTLGLFYKIKKNNNI